MKSHAEKVAEMEAASRALAEMRTEDERKLRLQVSVKLAERVRSTGNLPDNAPQCLGALVTLLEEIERLNGLRPLDQTDHAAIDAAWKSHQSSGKPHPADAINAHLADIVTDVGRVRKACNDDEREPKIGEDAILSRLADVSNALDDLYNEVVGI